MTNWRSALIEGLDGDGNHVTIKSTQGGSLNIAFGDSGSVDAFGRARVSDTGQRLDVEFLYNKQIDFFDEIIDDQTAGATPPTVTLNTNPRDLTLAVAATNTDQSAKMASYPVPYTPGNSQLIEITGVLDLANIGDGSAEVFLRSNITGTPSDLTTVEQGLWTNLTSGVEWDKSHIFVIDFQSLKVGRIRFGMVVDGVFSQVAEILNDNTRDSGYWQLANLPVFWHIYNDATDTYMEIGYGDDNNAVGFRYKLTKNATATMKAICCTVKSEGGLDLKDLPGLPRAIDMAQTATTVSTTLIPLLSIRPKSTYQSLDNLILALPKIFNVETDNPIRIEIIQNASLTGASWADVDTADSSVEYDTTATAVSGGQVVYSEYITTSSKNSGNSAQGILGKTVLWNRKGTQTGIFTLAAIRTGSNNANVLAGIGWEEIR